MLLLSAGLCLPAGLLAQGPPDLTRYIAELEQGLEARGQELGEINERLSELPPRRVSEQKPIARLRSAGRNYFHNGNPRESTAGVPPPKVRTLTRRDVAETDRRSRCGSASKPERILFDRGPRDYFSLRNGYIPRGRLNPSAPAPGTRFRFDRTGVAASAHVFFYYKSEFYQSEITRIPTETMHAFCA